ncbi:MAG TPA: hypothetical protein VF544_10625 [Pyrinomonadaceae bacterium]|jgi:hypothetical protein
MAPVLFIITALAPCTLILSKEDGRAKAAPRQEGKAVVPQDENGGPAGGPVQKPTATVLIDKKNRTPAENKINSQLLYAIYRKRGEANRAPSGELRVKFDEKGRAIVNIRARVTKTLLSKIKSLGGKVISSFERYRDIRAHMPLEKLEELAALKDVIAIIPGDEATTNSRASQ